MPRDYSKEICAYLRSMDISLGKLSESLERIADHFDWEKVGRTYNVITPCSDRDILNISSTPLDETVSYSNELTPSDDRRNVHYTSLTPLDETIGYKDEQEDWPNDEL